MAPVRFRAVASGLRMEKVRSTAMRDPCLDGVGDGAAYRACCRKVESTFRKNSMLNSLETITFMRLD
jgi:hypothetical protein